MPGTQVLWENVGSDRARIGGFMLYLLIGVGTLIVAAFTFWSMLPVGGKVNAKIKPAWEPYIVVGIVFFLGLGVALIVTGAYDILT